MSSKVTCDVIYKSGINLQTNLTFFNDKNKGTPVRKNHRGQISIVFGILCKSFHFSLEHSHVVVLRDNVREALFSSKIANPPAMPTRKVMRI